MAVRDVEERALHVITSNIMAGESALLLFKISLLRELHFHEVNHPAASLVGPSYVWGHQFLTLLAHLQDDRIGAVFETWRKVRKPYGKLNMEDLKFIVQAYAAAYLNEDLNVSHQQALAMMTMVDSKRDGEVDSDEFRVFARSVVAEAEREGQLQQINAGSLRPQLQISGRGSSSMKKMVV